MAFATHREDFATISIKACFVGVAPIGVTFDIPKDEAEIPLKTIIIGGIVPAVFWAITGALQKVSAQQGTPPTVYLAVFGFVICLSGLVPMLLLDPDKGSLPGLAFAGLAGVSFSLGTAAISFALWRYGAAISKLTPVLNTNILITVAIGLIFLREAAGVNIPQLVVGAVLVIVGATIVATA